MGLTVRLIVVVLTREPLVPVIVTIAAPTAAVLLAVSVSVLAVVEDEGLKVAETPLGRPVAEKATLLEKPPVGTTVTDEVPLVPWFIATLVGFAETV